MSNVTFDATEMFEFAGRWDGAEQIVGQELTRGIDRVTIRAEAITKQNTGVKSGHGRRSITHKPATFGGGVAKGSWGTNVWYMKIHENGRGSVVASPGKMLRFEIGGKVLFRKRVGPAAGRFMFRKAMIQVRPMVRREMQASAQRIASRLGGR